MKIKLLLVFVLSLIWNFSVLAQPYGNEWINYSQKYYKLPVVQEGIYKITYQTLQNNGIDPSQFSPLNMQIFGRDKEQPIVVFDGGDNSFDANDYFVFYAERNNGWLDSTLFEDPNTIGNPGTCIFNDTINYFFTWNNLTTNKRFTIESANASEYSNFTESIYVWGFAEVFGTAAYNIAYLENGVQLSQFSPGEGYYNGMFGGEMNGTDFVNDVYFNLPSLYSSNLVPNAIFHGKSNSNSNADTDGTSGTNDNHHLKWELGNDPFGSNNLLIVDSTFQGHQQIISNRNVPNYFLQNSLRTRMTIIDDLGALTDYQSFSYMSLYYPRTGNFNGLNKDIFYLKNPTNASKTYVKVTNSTIGANPFMLVFGGTSSKYIVPENLGGGSWRALITNSGNNKDQKVVFQDPSNLIEVTSLTPVNQFTNSAYFTDMSTLIYDSSNLMIFHPTMDSVSKLYRDYRVETGYNVVLANIEELYLQFGGGIRKHNAAIRRFALYAYDHSTVKPLAITLLGKGYSSCPATGQSKAYNLSTYSNLSFIPAFGNPGSDICYTANLRGSGYAPLIPIGRISVNTNAELGTYLDKLREYENQQDQSSVYNSANKDWQKQILHFAGGNPGYQADQLFQKMEGWRGIIEDYYYGGNVTSYRRTSYDPLDPITLDNLATQLTEGVSLVTFLGHSSADGFDITIDEPQNWNNDGKYPIVYGNGCHSGDIYSRDNSFGEKMIRIADEGAIAYIGSSDQEYDSNVDIYSIELYKQFSNKNYGAPIGLQIANTVMELQSNGDNNFNSAIKGTYGAVNLNGDPLLKLNWHSNPEIEITEQSLYFYPNELDLTVDSFDINLTVKNLGKSVVDTFYIEIKRDFPNSPFDSIYTLYLPKLNYIDSISIKVPTDAQISIGTNQITASVDLPEPGEVVEQYDEINNNQIAKSIYLKFDAIVPVYPYEFSVIPKDSVTVKASTVNAIGPVRKYLFELDTTDTFDSPIKRHFSMTGLGGVKEVKFNEWLNNNDQSFPLLFGDSMDSMVFFWRTAIDSSILEWNESSFQFIRGKEGWGQDHFFQFKKNSFSNINYNRTDRKREFNPFSRNLEVYLKDNAAGGINYTSLDNQKIEKSNLPYPIIYMAVIDNLDLNALNTIHQPNSDQVQGYDFLNYNNECYTAPCLQRQQRYFWYYQDQEGLNNLNTALNTLIPENHYVMLFTSMYADYSTWNQYCPGLYQTLANMGAVNITPTSEERAFIFFSQDGFPNMAQQRIATAAGESLVLDIDINSAIFQGEEESTLIGPSTEWKTLYWKQDPEELAVGDTTSLHIELFNNQKTYIQSIDTVFTSNDSILDLSTIINANQYPYLKLKAGYEDKVFFTPAQVDRWHVLYSPVPEAAIDGTNQYSLFPKMDTIPEGIKFNFAVDIKNISDYHMDSLLVSYFVEDKNHVKHYIDYPRQDSLKVNQVLRDTLEINTSGFSGLNSLWVEVNPYVNGSIVQTDQPEQYHFNNLIQIPFYVKSDDVNPILDVTFDGRHILNGDIVDPQSEIYISLKDDNEFQIMDNVSDTALFGIFLTSPDGIKKRIPFMNGQGETVMQWIPAESSYKKFKIIYPALFEQDGIYKLEVQGTDRSGNLSGDLEYKINFEVIHESSITYLMNYPNPFSTSTRFVFTLTGSEIPEEFLVQIMTISGKVVRQITEDDLGPIHIGRNITEYAWDGTDDFGDPLANGVYIYRVLSRLNGEEIKHRESDGDKYFTKEYGKMYIIR